MLAGAWLAIGTARAALAAEPAPPGDLFVGRLLRLGLSDEAGIEARRLVLENGAEAVAAETAYRVGMALALDGKPGQAVAFLEQAAAATEDPKRADQIQLATGVVLLRAREFPHAVHVFARVEAFGADEPTRAFATRLRCVAEVMAHDGRPRAPASPRCRPARCRATRRSTSWCVRSRSTCMPAPSPAGPVGVAPRARPGDRRGSRRRPAGAGGQRRSRPPSISDRRRFAGRRQSARPGGRPALVLRQHPQRRRGLAGDGQRKRDQASRRLIRILGPAPSTRTFLPSWRRSGANIGPCARRAPTTTPISMPSWASRARRPARRSGAPIELALAHHPDRAGPASADTFARIAEAYHMCPTAGAEGLRRAPVRARARLRRRPRAIGRPGLECLGRRLERVLASNRQPLAAPQRIDRATDERRRAARRGRHAELHLNGRGGAAGRRSSRCRCHPLSDLRRRGPPGGVWSGGRTAGRVTETVAVVVVIPPAARDRLVVPRRSPGRGSPQRARLRVCS